MNPNSDDLKDDYSDLFATQTPVRGKYYELAMRAKHLVELDQEVLEAFPTKADVNAALRSLMEASKHIHLPH